MNIWLATILTFTIALIWIRSIDFMASKNMISSNMSRKVIHIGTGPIFILCWLLFPESVFSRFLAALVPLMITGQFTLVGSGVIKDQASIDAMSRSGDRREILHGPLYYGITFILITIIFWKNSPIGIIALMTLCGGDGMADIIGNSFPKKPWPWSPKKSVLGSVGMLLGSLIFSFVLISIYQAFNVFSLDFPKAFMSIIVISLVAAIVESLPFEDIDNITVPISSVLLGILFF